MCVCFKHCKKKNTNKQENITAIVMWQSFDDGVSADVCGPDASATY